MNNRDLFNEGFFKKKTYNDKLNQKYTQYSPISDRGLTQTGFNALNPSDTDEMKKRLTKTFGMTIGSNSIKSLANKAIKRFPIIISENVDPNTAVLLKNYLEVQYAEYLNLLISNQIIDLADYKRNSPEGNIAIQAVENITGTEFGQQRLANKALSTGELSLDDMLKNVPIYQLLRQEGQEFIDDAESENLLEDAIIVDSTNADKVVDLLNEMPTYMDPFYSYNPSSTDNKSPDLLANVSARKSQSDEHINDLIKRGYSFTDKKGYEHYDRLTNTEVVADANLLSNAINKSVGDLLLDENPASKYLRDRFEKATWLLQSRIIAGMEYAAYTQHLGLPLRRETYRTLIKEYPVKDIINYSNANGTPGAISAEDAKLIAKGQRNIPKIVSGITSVKLKYILKPNLLRNSSIAAGASAAAVGLSTLTGVALAWPIIPIVTGTTLLATLLKNIASAKKKHVSTVKQQYNTWERVEQLIQDMDEQTYRIKVDAAKWNIKNQDIEKTAENEIQKRANTEYEAEKYFDFGDDAPASHDLVKSVNKFKTELTKLYEAAIPYETDFEEPLTLTESSLECYKDAFETMDEIFNESLLEKVQKISLSKPADIKAAKKQMPLTVLKYNDDTDYIVPSYGAADLRAYGSVEFDRREIKDRKYNTPLTLKVTFKERYNDGRAADGEMTAVIGILGVITRVPAEEMKAILQANTQNTTIKGIFNGDKGESLSDLLANFKAKSDYSKTPISAETWKNLEKVSQLAKANSLAGKVSNNIANAHIIFGQQEIDAVRQETGIDYMRDAKLSASLMKRYSAMSLMVANDTLERVFVFDDIDAKSWNIIPYDTIRGRDSSDLMASIASKFR